MLKIIGEPKTVIEVFEELNQKGYTIKYRESVYRGLEKLVDAALVEKYYDKTKKSICYKLLTEKIEINLAEGRVRRV